MNIQHAINIGSAGVASIALSLSLPLCIDRLSDDSLPPSLPAPSLPALSLSEGNTLVYPSRLPQCDHEDGTSTSNGIDVPACIWDASRGNGTGTSFIVIAR